MFAKFDKGNSGITEDGDEKEEVNFCGDRNVFNLNFVSVLIGEEECIRFVTVNESTGTIQITVKRTALNTRKERRPCAVGIFLFYSSNKREKVLRVFYWRDTLIQTR